MSSATLTVPTLTLLSAESANASQPLSRRRGLSVTGPADDHADAPAKKGPGAILFGFQQQQQQQPPQPAPTPPAAMASSPSPFGPAPTGILGGSLPPAPSSSSAAATSLAPASSSPFGGFSFPPKPAAAAGASSSPFGSAPNMAASSAAPAQPGLFGTSSMAPSTSTTAGPFGSAFGASSSGAGAFGSAPAAGASGLFGSSSTTAASNPIGGAFGSAAATSAPSLFGSTAPAPTSTGLFGAPSTNTGFGASTNSAFGASTTSAFGAPSTQLGAFGASTASQPPGGLQDSKALVPSRFKALAASQAGKQEVNVADRILQNKNAWDRSNPACRFHYFFYNVVAPEQVRLYARPPLAQNEFAWQTAVRANPDPSRLVPVLAVGFSDLKRRAAAQEAQASQHLAKLEEVSTVLTQLARKHTLETAARLDKLQSAQTHLLSRLMHLISRLHPLTSLAKTSIRPEEEALARRLTELKLAIDGKSTGAGRQHVVGKARVGELWALLGQVKAMSADRARGESGWAVVDEAELHKVLNVLSQQQAGLDHLVRTLKKMTADLEVMRASFGVPTTRLREDERM